MKRYEYPILDPDVSEPDGKGYKHKVCGEELSGRRVYLSHRIGGIPLAGSGQVELVTVPYCKSCDVPPPPDSGTYMDDGTISHPSFRLVREPTEAEIEA